MISESSLADLRARNPVSDVAGKWVSLRRGSRKGRLIGPCPLHSPDPHAKDSTAFECWGDGWVCARCQDGGDVIRLVQLRERLGFREAVDWLGGAQETDPAEDERRARAAAERKAADDAKNAAFREAERKRCWEFWQGAGPLAGTPVEAYLREIRRVDWPDGAALRAHPAMPYLEHGQDEAGRTSWRLLHEGPAMLAAIAGPDGRMAGLHITWIDLDAPKGKLALVHPTTGEKLPAKKVRGSLAGGRIELLRAASPCRLFIGEGIETVLTVFTALRAAGRCLDGTAMWTSISLGNLAGKAADHSRVPHPSERTPAGRVKQVPGPEPDMDSAAVPVPDSVMDLRLLGDGDSDPFTTRLTMARAERRHMRQGRRVATCWPPAGHDFNSMVVA
ncbi:DUF7146 domain-containing protein [Ancylobacter vacuolatus]|uniref:Zinc finger CHC2-type domain-containing protein n=1 Tax=Ancylobacter vacuolatus TaxID=223389 RepID=A0ABU0DN70_9HYPH|nr:CHC2 zinc finger domain-containing protein [Ancylobacter vacuolatus]MDQ0349751.1 hypothetical protein [Ancylobacter vacuolatus]